MPHGFLQASGKPRSRTGTACLQICLAWLSRGERHDDSLTSACGEEGALESLLASSVRKLKEIQGIFLVLSHQ
ncbi:hypothetical protein I7I48_07690 [Histoplasma ohiense]|nr:hypothetical protein I7I48_07690 [Histoplasma ohiense (nom. inval.)]